LEPTLVFGSEHGRQVIAITILKTQAVHRQQTKAFSPRWNTNVWFGIDFTTSLCMQTTYQCQRLSWIQLCVLLEEQGIILHKRCLHLVLFIRSFLLSHSK